MWGGSPRQCSSRDRSGGPESERIPPAQDVDERLLFALAPRPPESRARRPGRRRTRGKQRGDTQKPPLPCPPPAPAQGGRAVAPGSQAAPPPAPPAPFTSLASTSPRGGSGHTVWPPHGHLKVNTLRRDLAGTCCGCPSPHKGPGGLPTPVSGAPSSTFAQTFTPRTPTYLRTWPFSASPPPGWRPRCRLFCPRHPQVPERCLAPL